MNMNKAMVAGNLGADARIHQSDNGRWSIRISVATREPKGDEDTTTWHSVCYWSGSDREVEFLRSQLVRGAKVFAEGRLSVYKRPHPEFPVEMTVTGIDASELYVISTPAGNSVKQVDVQEQPIDEPEPEPAPAVPAQPPRPVQRPPARTMAFAESAPVRPQQPTPRQAATVMPAHGAPMLNF